MDDEEIRALEEALDALPEDLVTVDANITVGDFCIDSIKELMHEGQKSPRKTFAVMHAGSLYYCDMVVKAIAPPYEAREPGEDAVQWFGQRPT